MPNFSSDQFANRNLRNRSFRNQTLNHVSFQGSDLRGCDFRNTQLVGANFEQVRIGLAPEKLLILAAIVLFTILLVGQSIMQLIFGALGQTSDSKAWNYVLVLYGSLSVAGAVSALSALQIGANWGRVVSATLTGAFLGFFMSVALLTMILMRRSSVRLQVEFCYSLPVFHYISLRLKLPLPPLEPSTDTEPLFCSTPPPAPFSALSSLERESSSR
jgi:hypothetical protein